MRRFVPVPLLAGLLLLIAGCADVRTSPAGDSPLAASRALPANATITVMSRNLYLGADVGALMAPGADPSVVLPAVLAQLDHTDYPVRAQYLAMEIAARMPEVVGLQEVTHYTMDTVAGPQDLDFLDVLQAYLAAMGAQYDVAVRQNNVTLFLPVGAGGLNSVTYTDGDAILVRHDVAWSDPAAGHYASQITLSVGGFNFSNMRGWNAVTVDVDGFAFRFVNTHLEVQQFRAVQEQQARELVALLANETLPVVAVGDYNSAANPSAPDDSKTESYHILRNAGFADLELRDAHSATLLTCCHASDLSDTVASFDQRLDLVLARFGNAGFGGRSNVEAVVGGPIPDPRGYTLWPSDHAAVFGTLWVAPGLAAR